MLKNYLPFHYRPDVGTFGDAVPFFWKGKYHLFYLRGNALDWDNGWYTPFEHLVSTDMIHWNTLPTALNCGAHEDVDMSLGTCSIIEKDGTFYMYYCGRTIFGENLHQAGFVMHDMEEKVCFATSKDLIHWTKSSTNPVLSSKGTVFTTHDFRDPFPFWNEEEQCYWLSISSELADKTKYMRGTPAIAKSTDLEHWELCGPLFKDHMMPWVPECTDIFKMNDKWYLVSGSDLSARMFMANSLQGPWKKATQPNDDRFYNFYAPKTLCDGQRRLLFGWMAVSEGAKDEGINIWSGNMCTPRQLVQQPDGKIKEVCPKEICDYFDKNIAVRYTPIDSEWEIRGETICSKTENGYALLALDAAPDSAYIETNIVFDSLEGAAGIVFRAKRNLDEYYSLNIVPGAYMANIDRYPIIPSQKYRSSKTIVVEPGKMINIKLIIDNDMVEAFIDNSFVLSCRINDFNSGMLGLYTDSNCAKFIGTRVSVGG